MVKVRSWLIAALFTAAVSGVPAQSRLWQPDERILITSFADVGAIATDTRKLYIAASAGLAVYDHSRLIWEFPSTVEDEYPAGEQPTALAYDPLQMELWLGTANGGLHCWRAVPSRWETVAFALGQIHAIVPSIGVEDEGIWVQTALGWYRAGRLAFGASPVSSDRIAGSIARRAAAQRTIDPSLSAFRARIGLDPLGRRWPITSFAVGDRPELYWLGTNGNMVLRFDPTRGGEHWLWYGAPTRGVSAIAKLGDTLWFGGDGRGPRSGLVRTTRDLQRWFLLEPRRWRTQRSRRTNRAYRNTHIYRRPGWSACTRAQDRALATPERRCRNQRGRTRQYSVRWHTNWTAPHRRKRITRNQWSGNSTRAGDW